MPAWEGGQGPRDRAGSWAEAKAQALGVDELMQERVWGEKENGAENRALEDSHSCGSTAAGREGSQEETEPPERWGWFPHLLPLFQGCPTSAPPLPLKSGGRRDPGACPASGRLQGERQSSQRLECLGSRTGPGQGGGGGGNAPSLTLPGCVTSDVRHTSSVPQPLRLPEGITTGLLHRAAVTIKWGNACYALGTWAWQALGAQ